MNDLTPRDVDIECLRNLCKDAYGVFTYRNLIDEMSDWDILVAIEEVSTHLREIEAYKEVDEPSDW